MGICSSKNRLPAVCHAFKIDRNAIQTAGVIPWEKCLSVRTTAVIHSEKNFHLLGWQRFSIQNSKLFSLSNRRGFPYRKGKVDSAFRDALDLPNCHTLVTEHFSLLAYNPKVLLYRCQDIWRFFHFHWAKIIEQDARTKLFPWLSSCFQLRHFGTLGHQNMYFAVCFVSIKP